MNNSKHCTEGLSNPNRNVSYSHPTIRVQHLFDCFTFFFVGIDEKLPGLGWSVTELSPCSKLLYHLYKEVFLKALFPKLFLTFRAFPVLIFVRYTKFNRRTLLKGSHFLYSDYLCHSLLFDIEWRQIGIVMSLSSISNQGRCIGITHYRKRLSQSFCLNTEFLVKTD